MKSLIIYGSCYGSARRYALTFAQMTGINVINYRDMKDCKDYDQIIYFGGLYAGGLKGLKKSIKRMKMGTRIIIVTVGLGDVSDAKTTDHIKRSLLKQIPDAFFKEIQFFHLRGAIDYQHLHFIHKMMMKMLYLRVKQDFHENQDPETQLFLQTYGQKVDFIDFEALSIIKEKLK